MPGFELEHVNGGQPVDVPYGETVIGRGPFLGVSDKRVSRNHGILENVDGQLRLKPIHLNPCFVQASLEAPAEPLQKDQWYCLKEGSIFSLLPGKYVFRVRMVTEDSTLSNSLGLEDEKPDDAVEKSKPPPECGETLEYIPQGSSSVSQTPELSFLPTQREEEKVEPHSPDPASCRQVVSDVLCPNEVGDSAPPTPQRKRVLPAWMTAAIPVAQSPSTAKGPIRTPARAAPKTTQSKRTPGPKRARNQQLSSGDEDKEDEEEQSDVEQKPKKRARKLNSDTEESQDQATAPKPSRKKSVEDHLSEDSEREEEKNKGKGKGRKRADAAPVTKAGESLSPAEDSGNLKSEKEPSQDKQQSSKNSTPGISSSSSKPEVPRRTPCPYGSSCYRKNPIHFQECSHPGDNDYEEDQNNGNEDDVDDDRPECPYGTDCYRKNPLHKKEYKHTKPPAKASVTDDEDDEDEDRYEDSFINDESEEEEVDEDSDYVPESDDSGKEDIKRLRKEAKAFLRRKK